MLNRVSSSGHTPRNTSGLLKWGVGAGARILERKMGKLKTQWLGRTSEPTQARVHQSTRHKPLTIHNTVSGETRISVLTLQFSETITDLQKSCRYRRQNFFSFSWTIWESVVQETQSRLPLTMNLPTPWPWTFQPQNCVNTFLLFMSHVVYDILL